MKGIILAAGRGSRLGPLTDESPKCLTLLAGKPLINWQMEAFYKNNFKDLGVVLGYQANQLKFPEWKAIFENLNWKNTNMVMSLVCASEWLNQDTCLISYSDIVYHPDHLNRLVNTKGDIVITYDKNWLELWSSRFEEPLSDAETFKLDSQGHLIEIGNRSKSIEEIEGQYMGLLKITPKGWLTIHNYLSSLKKEEQNKLDMTGLLNGLLRKNQIINTVAIHGNWLEVDTKSDLDFYSSHLENYPFLLE